MAGSDCSEMAGSAGRGTAGATLLPPRGSYDSDGATGAMDAIAPVIRARPADDAGDAVRLTARRKACQHRVEPDPEFDGCRCAGDTWVLGTIGKTDEEICVGVTAFAIGGGDPDANGPRGSPGYRLLATWEKTVLRLVPTVPITTTAATAISAAIKPYSIAVTPSSFSIKRRKRSRLRIISSPSKVWSAETEAQMLQNL